mmetsp:Transcript_19384/g.29747  ORF Transcript_19384/g.29747 Transcript_19384/m.29747 type:complete len:94 (-) Transcript_19384:4563-4844(-)
MFENRVRQLITEIVNPLQDRQKDIIDKFQTQNYDFNLLRRRFEELEFIMQKVQRQSNSFDEVKHGQDRFQNEIRNQVVSIRNELNNNINRINT